MLRNSDYKMPASVPHCKRLPTLKTLFLTGLLVFKLQLKQKARFVICFYFYNSYFFTGLPEALGQFERCCGTPQWTVDGAIPALFSRRWKRAKERACHSLWTICIFSSCFQWKQSSPHPQRQHLYLQTQRGIQRGRGNCFVVKWRIHLWQTQLQRHWILIIFPALQFHYYYVLLHIFHVELRYYHPTEPVNNPCRISWYSVFFLCRSYFYLKGVCLGLCCPGMQM